METPKVLYQLPEAAGKSWMPSNGTEFMMFEEAFCSRCIHEKWIHSMNDEHKKCDVLNRCMANAPDPQPEWQYNSAGWPVCTQWQKWDWGRDDDGNWNDPEIPDPIDPSQLSLFPLHPDERDFQERTKAQVNEWGESGKIPKTCKGNCNIAGVCEAMCFSCGWSADNMGDCS